MKLNTILGAIGASAGRGGINRDEVRGLAVDSRRAGPGELFFAIRGGSVDGHDFIAQAASRGAMGAVVSRRVEGVSIPQYVVDDTRHALALAACELHDHPSHRFPVIGITGTNGKTTTAFLVRDFLDNQGVNCGLLGTIHNILGPGKAEDSSLTTAEASDIQQWLARMIDNHCRAAVMEVSSHGLHQKRTLGTRFEVGLFTNLTPDHLDYHADMEEYFRAKCLLFEELGAQGRAVVGWDDPFGERLCGMIRGPLLRYGVREGSEIRILDWKPLADGARIALSVFGRRIEGVVALIGGFNAQNVAAAVGACSAMGITASGLEESLPGLRSVPGRMEPVRRGQPFRVLVDYAHTPDALEKALQAAREHTPGRLVSVVGCGGDRFRGKRPEMGRISVERADLTVVTSDNPRSEDPARIIEDILEGVREAGAREGENYIVIRQRREAIFEAVRRLGPEDTLLIAGKGHEDYQILPTGTIHFDDREVAAEALTGAGYEA